MFIYKDEFFRGVLGKVTAIDDDPHDRLTYHLVVSDADRHYRYFSLAESDGSLRAKYALDEGLYKLNVSVSDGRHSSYTHIKTHVVRITEEMVQHAATIHLGGVTPEEFVVTYRHSFIRGIKFVMNVHNQDVIIISIQKVNVKTKRGSSDKIASKSPYSSVISVLFVVRKSDNSYYKRSHISKVLNTEQKQFESHVGLHVIKINDNLCDTFRCPKGPCEEQVVLDKVAPLIRAENFSFTSLHHINKALCICPEGFGGRLCDRIINKCARQPCPTFKNCIPDNSELGYACVCPKDLFGAQCTQNISECIGNDQSPKCYTPKSPLSFKGRSFIQYVLKVPIEKQFYFSVWFQTLHPSGNLFFMSENIDYSILEVSSLFIILYVLLEFCLILSQFLI